MKKVIFALFTDEEIADRAINQIHNDLDISNEEISYVYRDKSGKNVSGTGDNVADTSTAEGAVSGATAGGLIGAAIGLVGIAGLLGPLAPIVVAGPLATFLGITGAAGAVVGTGIAGAAIGGLVGALVAMGVSEPQAKNFEERINAGDILVSIHSENVEAVTDILRQFNAKEITAVAEKV